MHPSSVRNLPTPVLLALLVGDEAARALAGRSLIDVFALSAGSPSVQEVIAPYADTHTIEAAKELLSRALAEKLRESDCLAAPAAVRDLLRLRYAGLPHEIFAVLLLDARNRLIDAVELFRGTLTQTSVYPREVVKLTVERNAAAVVLVHNHPSGSAEPSEADERLTRTLKDALALVDVRVLDHFIVAGTESPVSFAERGLI